MRQYQLSNKLVNRFNAAAWRDFETGHIFLMPREVNNAGKHGEPDKGTLVILELDHCGEIINEQIVWQPTGDEIYLEDPRALQLQNGKVLLGLTAVIKEPRQYVPYPAVITLNSSRHYERLPNPVIIKNLGPGKNLTPVNENTFFFRKDGDNNSHKLYVIEHLGDKFNEIGEIEFSLDIPWASWRIGTTMPPIWVNENEALMLIHGIKIENGKYVYSLGRTKLKKTEDRYSVEIDPNPILTPDDFTNEGQSIIEELHPELRRVVYSCGGVVKSQHDQEILSLFTNVGDKQTVEVPFTLNSLKQGWWS